MADKTPKGKTVQDILIDGLDNANVKLDTLLERTAKTSLRSKINSVQIASLWAAFTGAVIYFSKCGGILK